MHPLITPCFRYQNDDEEDEEEDAGVSIAQPLESVFDDIRGEDRTEEEQKTFEVTADDPKRRLFAGTVLLSFMVVC